MLAQRAVIHAAKQFARCLTRFNVVGLGNHVAEICDVGARVHQDRLIRVYRSEFLYQAADGLIHYAAASTLRLVANDHDVEKVENAL